MTTNPSDVSARLRAGVRKVAALKQIAGMAGASATTLDRLQQTADQAANLLAEREWRDISACPRDGTRVLLIDRWGNIFIARWIGDPHNFFTLDGFRHVQKPTHWQPLPSPPKLSEPT